MVVPATGRRSGARLSLCTSRTTGPLTWASRAWTSTARPAPATPRWCTAPGRRPRSSSRSCGALHARHPDRAVLATRLSDEAIAAVGDLAGRRARPRRPGGDAGPAARAARHRRRGQRRHLRRDRSPPRRRSPRGSTAPGSSEIHDVGVAGLHRLLDVRDRLAAADCLVVVAGMEGALPVRGRRPDRRAAGRGAHAASGTAPPSAGWPRCWRCSTPARPG